MLKQFSRIEGLVRQQHSQTNYLAAIVNVTAIMVRQVVANPWVSVQNTNLVLTQVTTYKQSASYYLYF